MMNHLQTLLQIQLAPPYPGVRERNGGGAHVARCGAGPGLGKTVQVDPIKPRLKAPVSKSLKLKYDELLSNVASKFNLRRYNLAGVEMSLHPLMSGRGLHSSTSQLNLSLFGYTSGFPPV